jgi:hypothetical protein
VIFAEIIVIALSIYLFFNPPVYYTHQPDTLPEGCISSNQAYSIAIPHIREYAQEHNRIILGIDMSFWNSSKDLSGQRGDPSLRYPSWEVSAYFAKDYRNPHSYDGYPSGVFGYSVLIWADTGQLRYKSAMGFK